MPRRKSKQSLSRKKRKSSRKKRKSSRKKRRRSLGRKAYRASGGKRYTKNDFPLDSNVVLVEWKPGTKPRDYPHALVAKGKIKAIENNKLQVCGEWLKVALDLTDNATLAQLWQNSRVPERRLAAPFLQWEYDHEAASKAFLILEKMVKSSSQEKCFCITISHIHYCKVYKHKKPPKNAAKKGGPQKSPKSPKSPKKSLKKSPKKSLKKSPKGGPKKANRAPKAKLRTAPERWKKPYSPVRKAWIRGETPDEIPAHRLFYTPEQQDRMGIDKKGNKRVKKGK